MMKFKPEVLAAHEEDQWSLLSALRGPDSGKLILKSLTIAVRRAAIADVDEYAKFRLIDLRYDHEYFSDNPEYFDDLRREFRHADRHWKDHIYDALVAAEKLKILDEIGKKLLKAVREVMKGKP